MEEKGSENLKPCKTCGHITTNVQNYKIATIGPNDDMKIGLKWNK